MRRLSAFSKYCFEVISFPSSSSSCRLKSLRTHRKSGNICSIASLSSPYPTFFWINWERFATMERFWMAFSSIWPIEL